VPDNLRITDPIAKKKLLDRLARIEGQVRGLGDMIEREETCESIVQQISALRGALNKTYIEMVTDEIKAIEFSESLDGVIRRDRIDTLVKLLEKYG
jgi:DNA-binding FrmR family transcriptional regulator